MARFVHVGGLWSVDQKNILQGPNSAPLSETMVEDLCHGRALSIPLTVTHTVWVAGWRRLKSRRIFNPEVCGVQE